MFSLKELKLKAETALSSAKTKASELTQQVKDYMEQKSPALKEKVEEFVEENKPRVENIISSTIDIVKEKAGEIKDTIFEYKESLEQSKTMEHKIIMLGGRRAGKSTILSSILHVLRKETPGSICTINDKTDYTSIITDENGKTCSLPTLDVKRLEVGRYMKDHPENATFLVDMTPTYGKASYILRVNSGTANIDLEFVDVPGEWMRRNSNEFNELREQIKTSDVYIIAIDTPFLMQEDDDVNSVYNRVQEITDVISEINIKPDIEADRRLILLCPVKCEKWVQAGEGDKVTEKVKKVYKDLINKWVKFPNVDIWVMPIQTVGGLESVRLLPAKVYWKNEQEKGSGTSCSEDELTGMLMDKDGKTIDPAEVYRIEDDQRWDIDYTPIPLSWYRKNKMGFNPKDCEQPGFHILRFLVEKEENVIKKRAEYEREKLEKKGPIWRFLNAIFNPTFGQYLPVWRKVIDEMKARHLLKEQGDGFENVKTIVEDNKQTL